MKKLMSSLFAVVLSLSIAAWGYQSSQSDQSQQGGQGQQSGQAQQSDQSQQGGQNSQQSMSGQVSDNGKTFTDSHDKKTYKVSNPDALKGHEGQEVGLIVHVDPDTNTIHIIQLEAPPTPQR
ncbi:MAG TPA: hypothetical protein VFA76_16800 [Terriglobales bacterium]|nr:hypothetical protein [Terriglobales bacterium]